MNANEYQAIVEYLKTGRHNTSLPFYDDIKCNPEYATLGDPQLDSVTRKKLRKKRRDQLKNAKKYLKAKAKNFQLVDNQLTVLRKIRRPFESKEYLLLKK